MNRQLVEDRLVAKCLMAGSGSVGSKYAINRSTKTKGGTEFTQGEMLTLKEYTREYPYRAKFQTEDGRAVNLPVDIASRILTGFPKPPSLGTMQRWSDDGVAKAVDGARVEPDGFSPAGAPSWMLIVGVI